MKKIVYISKTICFQLILIFLTPYILVKCGKFVSFKISSCFEVDVNKLNMLQNKYVAYILIVLVIYFLIRKYNKKNNEFWPPNTYCDINIFFFMLARFLGYGKVNLKFKSIPLQYQLLCNTGYDCIDDSDLKDIDCDYKVIEKGKLKPNEPINIIIGDTYPIYDNQIPENILNNYTIIFQRIYKEGCTEGVRVKPNKQIDLLNDFIQEMKNTNKVFNIIATTPGLTNKAICDRVFKTAGRDGFVLYVYGQDASKNFAVKSRRVKIKS